MRIRIVALESTIGTGGLTLLSKKGLALPVLVRCEAPGTIRMV